MATMTAPNRIHEPEKRLQCSEKLKTVTERIHSANNISEILVQVQADMLTVFDADRITIYTIVPIRKQLVSKFMVGSEVKAIRVAFGAGVSPDTVPPRTGW